MSVWTPEKHEIEETLESLARSLRHAKSVSEVEDMLLDEISILQCGIQNRAAQENGKRS